MDATNILKLMDEVHGSEGLYLLAPINQVAGFFTSQNNLIYVHIGFSQQQPKRQQRGPAWRRAGRVCVCG